jgi:hypothetical protein
LLVRVEFAIAISASAPFEPSVRLLRCTTDLQTKELSIWSWFISRVIRLALLAPDIVELVLAGKQPAHLTLRDLMGPFTVEWAGQREALINRDDD